MSSHIHCSSADLFERSRTGVFFVLGVLPVHESGLVYRPAILIHRRTSLKGGRATYFPKSSESEEACVGICLSRSRYQDCNDIRGDTRY
jgi:hypothetical protein